MFDDDLKAWDILKYTHGVTKGGVIYPYDSEKPATKRQVDAISYLVNEWDYDYAE